LRSFHLLERLTSKARSIFDFTMHVVGHRHFRQNGLFYL
jgi:hypothetical protein